MTGKEFQNAAMMGEKGKVLHGIKEGVDVNCNDGYAIAYAAGNGHEGVVKVLLDAGARLDGRWGSQALAWSAEAGHVSIAKNLINHGANVNVDDGKALILAVKNDQIKCAKLLLDHGADHTLVDSDCRRTLKAWFPDYFDKIQAKNRERLERQYGSLRRGVNTKVANLVQNR